jgi:hypothetical protein
VEVSASVFCDILALVAVAIHPSPEHPFTWASVPDLAYLADRVDRNGVVAVTHSGEALLLSEEGLVESRTKLNGARAVRYTGRALFTMARPDAGGSPTGEWIVSGQGESTVIVAHGVAVFSPKGIFSVPLFDTWSAVGVNGTGDSVVVMELPMNAPILTEYRVVGSTWAAVAPPLSPQVERVGFANMLPGFNDIRFVSQDTIVYIGSVWAFRSQMASIDESLTPHLSAPPLELAGEVGQPVNAWLFAVNLRTRVTLPLLRLDLRVFRRTRPQRFGSISVSKDGKWLYLACRDSIAKIDTTHFLTDK